MRGVRACLEQVDKVITTTQKNSQRLAKVEQGLQSQVSTLQAEASSLRTELAAARSAEQRSAEALQQLVAHIVRVTGVPYQLYPPQQPPPLAEAEVR